ncbi:MAG: hypothetical protein ACMUHY_04275 [Thermoplasmatota archaeon]
MEDQFRSQYQGQGQPPGGYQGQGYGAMPGGGYTESPGEVKRRKLKQTRIGIGLLMGAIGCVLVAILASPVPCIPALLGIGVLGLGISAYILLLMGAGALEKPHRTLVITSLVIIIIAYFITVIIAVMAVFSSVVPLMGSSSDETLTGQDMKDFFETVRIMAFFSIIPNVMMAVGYAMILFKPAKKWGRPLLGVFIGLAFLTSIGGALISYTLTGNIIDDIDLDRGDYELEDVQELQQDVTINSWLAGLIRVPEYIIYLIVAAGALLNVKRMEDELKPKLDDRLYNIKL